MKICILAGEKSGDNYGSLLCRKFKKLKQDIFIFGTGGERMEKEGANLIKGMPFGQMGFSGVIKKIFLYISFLKKLTKEIEKQNPDIIIFIDNPGFNLEVAKRLKKKYKTYYYIPPKIWAHNYKRIKIIKKYIDFVIPIFAFEIDIYKKENIPTFYFGHPFVDLINNEEKKEILKENRYVIGVLPGSRKEELIYNLPVMKKILENLKNKLDFKVLISAINEEFKRIVYEIFKNSNFEYKIEEDLYYIIQNSNLVLTVSGTVNLEVAYFKRPMIVFYKTSLLNYFLCRLIVKGKFISPINIILNEKVVPEYIQNFNIKDTVNDIIDIIKEGEIYKKEMDGFERMRKLLDRKNVSEKICKFILEGVKS
ncbi:MAG: lipid-A-disaccharide synthase [Candidatus Omnitrophica bacterium]|nr:lipid-A-disaccharide synthase [Candidatus Omnitrophota bacterium]MCM8802065.1 lipid-A-disaccharide synthase [Candidatus Omnitrophota bacterium]